MKLTYICHGFFLAYRDRPLLEDEVEAWKYGPAIREIFDHLPGGDVTVTRAFTRELTDFGSDTRLIDNVFKKFSAYSGIELSTLTHKPGTPWDITWKRYGQNSIIPQGLIKRHFKEVVAIGKVTADKGL